MRTQALRAAPDTDLAELLAEVRRIDVQSRRLARDVMSGSYVSVFRGGGLLFDSVREYVEGDDPRTVDWSVTARMGRPFVKTYVEERERTLLFLLDLSASMIGGFGPWSARQIAARVCACLAFSAVRNGDKVGLLTFGQQVEGYVPPQKGAAHALRLVRDCLALSATPGTTDMTPALAFASHSLRRHAIVFLVSDFLSGGWEHALALCARRHDLIAVRLLTPEAALPRQGLLQVRDPESGRTLVLDASAASVRAAYAERMTGWRMRTEKALAKAKVDLLDVPVPRLLGKDLVAGPILRFFRMRELRGAKR